MSAISGFINTIKNAVYGEQVRTAIVSALEQCYSDVNAPSLQTEAFETALNEAYAGGILDIQTVTSFSAMTNQKIIYRYNGTAAGKQKGLYYYSALSDSWVLIGSEIQKVYLLSQMTDVNDIYKYIGTESGMVQNSLYCHNGTSWVPIGSGLLTASSAAQMTNTDAIYKYTGSETGYKTNALYYYNGSEWALICPIESTEILTDEIKTAFLDCFKNVVWANANGEDYYNKLLVLLNNLVPISISAVFDSGDDTISSGASLDVLRQYLTVYTNYGNNIKTKTTDYTLSGTIESGSNTITVSYDSMTTTFVVSAIDASDELPAEYQEVQYIQSTGTQCILIESVKLQDNYISATVDFEITSESNPAKILIGAGSGAGKWFGQTNKKIVLGDSTLAFSDKTTTSRHTASLLWNNGTASAQIESTTKTATYSLPSTQEPRYFYLFGFYEANAYNYLISCKLYSCIINGFALVPCYRKSDGVIGLYDTKTSTFLTNSGTGTFSKGSDV